MCGTKDPRVDVFLSSNSPRAILNPALHLSDALSASITIRRQHSAPSIYTTADNALDDNQTRDDISHYRIDQSIILANGVYPLLVSGEILRCWKLSREQRTKVFYWIGIKGELYNTFFIFIFSILWYNHCRMKRKHFFLTERRHSIDDFPTPTAENSFRQIDVRNEHFWTHFLRCHKQFFKGSIIILQDLYRSSIIYRQIRVVENSCKLSCSIFFFRIFLNSRSKSIKAWENYFFFFHSSGLQSSYELPSYLTSFR